MEGLALQSSKISQRIFFSLKLRNFNHICLNYHENFYNNLLLTLRKVPFISGECCLHVKELNQVMWL